MSYKLTFLPKALKEWKKLDANVATQFKKKLKERLENPKVQKDKLRGFEHVYKIKLRTLGYRLAYEVKDDEIKIVVLVIGIRDKNWVYEVLKQRFDG